MKLIEMEMYLKNYKHYLGIFGEKILEEQAESLYICSFQVVDHVPQGSRKDKEYKEKGYDRKNYITSHSLNSKWEAEQASLVLGGEWKSRRDGRSVDLYQYLHYLIPDPEQHGESKLLVRCLMAKWPFLARFRVGATHLNAGEDTQVWIYTKSGRLQIPLRALIDGDYSLIEKATRKKFKKAEEILGTPEASLLRETLNGIRAIASLGKAAEILRLIGLGDVLAGAAA